MVDYSSYIQGQEANRGLAEVGALLRGDYNDHSAQIISDLEAKNRKLNADCWKWTALAFSMRKMLTLIAKNNPEAITEAAWAEFDAAYRDVMNDSPSSFEATQNVAAAQRLFQQITGVI